MYTYVHWCVHWMSNVHVYFSTLLLLKYINPPSCYYKPVLSLGFLRFLFILKFSTITLFRYLSVVFFCMKNLWKVNKLVETSWIFSSFNERNALKEIDQWGNSIPKIMRNTSPILFKVEHCLYRWNKSYYWSCCHGTSYQNSVVSLSPLYFLKSVFFTFFIFLSK